MAHEGRDVDGETFLQRCQVAVEGFPAPFKGAVEGGVGHFLDLLEHTHHPLPIPGLKGREGQGAVPGNDGGHAVLERGAGLAVPEQLDVKVGVGVDEPRRHDAARGIKNLGALGLDASSKAHHFAIL